VLCRVGWVGAKLGLVRWGCCGIRRRCRCGVRMFIFIFILDVMVVWKAGWFGVL
jgi:hypothetical protein